MKKINLLVIVGPTASGKSGLAVRLAKQLGGEIISADSRAIYRGMDIGTAKPSAAEQGGVAHFGLDLVEPDERFTVADFKECFERVAGEIRSRGKLPILVGGSGLYVDAVIYDYSFAEGAKADYRDRREMRPGVLVVGILWPREELRARIAARAREMFAADIVGETRALAARYSWDLQAMRSNIYPIVWRMISGEISQEEAMRLTELDDWHLARRQMTWFRRNKEIVWLPLGEVEEFVYKSLRQKE